MKYLLGTAAVIITCFAIFSCHPSNPVAPLPVPGPQLMFTEDKLPQSDGEYIYRQGIMIGGSLDEQNQYSWRVHTLSDIPLPGTVYDEDGWLWFRTPGSASDLPLAEPGDHRVLWTFDSELIFDITSRDGLIQNLVTRVDVRIQTPQGKITTISSPFSSNRTISSTISVPFADGATTGCGITFQLHETIGDVFVEGLYADHFMYRLNVLDSDLQLISSGEWFSSLNGPDIRKVTLSINTTPQISANLPSQYTQFEMYVVTRHGIREAGTHSVHFRAIGGFMPVTYIYPQHLCGLGQYHYGISSLVELGNIDLIPANGNCRNRQLWKNANTWEAINSPDFKLYLHLGFRGQYGSTSSSGGPLVTNNPFDSELNIVQNEQGVSYYSSIEFYDLRLNGAPFPVLAQFVAPFLITDTNGTTWLRVRNINSEASRLTLSGLSNDLHQIEARAVDSQGVHDSTPVVLNIRLIAFKPYSQRSGILVIDDTSHHSSASPEAVVNALYQSSVPTGFGMVDWMEVDALDYYGNVRPALLQNYQAALWFADNPGKQPNLIYNLDALEFYLGNHGRLIVSSTNQLGQALDGLRVYGQTFVSDRLGLEQSSDWGILSNNFFSNTFFVKAIGLDGFSDINLNISNAFNAIVNLRQGLSAITYFNPRPGLTPLYGFGSKPVDSPQFPPTQAQYDFYSSRYVGYRHDQNNASAFVLGFPLSYMQQSDVTMALSQLFTALIGNGRIR